MEVIAYKRLFGSPLTLKANQLLSRKRMTRSFIFQHPLIKLTIFRYTSIQYHQVNDE